MMALAAPSLTTALGLDKAFVGDIGTHQVDALRKVLDTAIVSLQRNLRLLGRNIFIIDAVLIANQFFAFRINISSREMTFLACAVIELERTVQLQIVIGIAKAAIAVRIPQQTIILIRQHKGNAHLCIILEQILVLTLHIELLALVLAQAIESLIFRAVKLHLPRETMFLLLGYGVTRLHTQFALRHREVPEFLSILRFLQQFLACCIKESHLTCSLRHDCLDILGFHYHVVTFLSKCV